MSSYVSTISEAVERLRCRDPTLNEICIHCMHYTDKDLAKLVDCLLAHPDVVTCVNLGCNRLTDKTGVKLAQYVAASSTIRRLCLSHNQFGSATYLALAAALRINTSLRLLYLHINQAISIEDQARIDMAFIDALILNPNRPVDSDWDLYSWDNEFKRLKKTAEELGHPSMQALLAITN